MLNRPTLTPPPRSQGCSVCVCRLTVLWIRWDRSRASNAGALGVPYYHWCSGRRVGTLSLALAPAWFAYNWSFVSDILSVLVISAPPSRFWRELTRQAEGCRLRCSVSATHGLLSEYPLRLWRTALAPSLSVSGRWKNKHGLFGENCPCCV